VSYEELSSGTKELQTGLTRIRRELETNFVSLSDGYARRMFPFVADAEERVLTLRDRVMAAGKAFNEVKAYYGEGDDRFDPSSNAEVFGRPTSLEFFGVFKTFTTSYNVSDVSYGKSKGRPDASSIAALPCPE
jgi:cytokinesis protein